MPNFKMKGGRVAAAALVALGAISVAVPSAVAAEQTDETVNAVNDAVGKEVTPEIAKNLNEWAASQDLDLDAEFQEDPVTISTETQKALADKHIVMFNRAGIEPPPGYVYDPSKGSLNDYCTKSPDQFPAPGDNADFSGACAKHDMCYGAHKDPRERVGCNIQLNKDMVHICKSVYPNAADPRRGGCLATAGTYFAAVTAAHPSQWNPTISG
ncbi:hypothetical protein [Corynebacterium tuberculostearicum]|uniref:hypothetical protein n=1 Tax=Corynebacterium tuberculostearicum TaxID=38304 RepID=UPI0026481560|nr:hypothetical protein [Corynebacterium tuberculostearicum]WKE57016.1 hypothetical protein J8247_09645 [Corynebacterium tuberculostearicum]WKE60578.1 hypothetical protein KAH61_05615 [Corynebacterium tuberculostearicum]